MEYLYLKSDFDGQVIDNLGLLPVYHCFYVCCSTWTNEISANTARPTELHEPGSVH